jgi:hypothetical protein
MVRSGRAAGPARHRRRRSPVIVRERSSRVVSGIRAVVVLSFPMLCVFWKDRPAPPPPAPSPETGTGRSPAAPARRDLPDPRLTFVTPFRNVRPDVKYVGDEVCASCHGEIAESFRRHPMGRSLAPIARAEPVERYDPRAHHPFEDGGFRYFVEHRGGKTYHREVRRDARGRTIVDTSWEVAYAVGAGSHGRSYLIERHGALLMSPITFYTRKGIWGLSPASRNYHFTRPIIGKCLFCHSNHADQVEGTMNRYRQPIFRGHAIGCERCHGPGELHVDRRERGASAVDMDDSIVNPKRLEPYLRDSVCEQCHLDGQIRVQRRGRDLYDFRPGLPLQLFCSVFVRPPEFVESSVFLGHAEQIPSSKCFLGSSGKLGCISCHDPHRLPEPGKRVTFYRQRCLSCHADRLCSLPRPERLRRSPEDSCIQCHMPRQPASVLHTAITDHRILRRPEAPDVSRPGAKLRRGQIPLVHFHKAHADPRDTTLERDLGIALMELGHQHSVPAVAEMAMPLVQRAVAADPADVDALDALALGHVSRGNTREAARVVERALELAPDREMTLDWAGLLAFQLGDYRRARDRWKAAIRRNPQRWVYHRRLADAHRRLGEASEQIAAADRAIELHPSSVDARFSRVTGMLVVGDERAAQEFQLLLALDPPNAGALRKAYDMIRASPGDR